METMKKNCSQGFTLIELLIVVAIIGILAAIAIPNFLQAQVRAKVSRTPADLRNLANAIELYRQDNNSYPLMGLIDQNVGAMVDPWVGAAGGGTWEQFLAMGIITTPIDYITREPWDPFHLMPKHNNLASNRYCYSSNDTYLSSSATLHMLDLAFGAWRVWGSGPDYDRRDLYLRAPSASAIVYDPTNGTISDGDIYRSQKSPDGRRIIVPGVVE